MSVIQSPVPPPGAGTPARPPSRAIYAMPMFATVHTPDLSASESWYTQGLGFFRLFAVPGPDGPSVVHLRRWQFQDLLLRPTTERRRAGQSCSVSFAAVYDEIDELAARARAHGAGGVRGPEDTRWNTSDLSTWDPDDNLVVFTAARPAGAVDTTFVEDMRRWNREQGLTGG